MRHVEEKQDPKKGSCKPLSDILADLVPRCQGGKGTSARSVWKHWDTVVGDALARNAQPAAFKGHTLVVHVSSSVWLQELHFRKADLIARLNHAAGTGAVEDIRFKLGTLPDK